MHTYAPSSFCRVLLLPESQWFVRLEGIPQRDVISILRPINGVPTILVIYDWAHCQTIP